MKFTIFMAAWMIALAINPALIETRAVGFGIIAFALAISDFVVWSVSSQK